MPDDGSGDAGGAGHGGGGRGFGAIGDLDAAGEFVDEAAGGLVDLRWLLGAVEAEGAGLGVKEDGAVGDLPEVVGGEAVLRGVGEYVWIPAVLKVGVEAVACRIALGEDEQAIVCQVGDIGDGV